MMSSRLLRVNTHSITRDASVFSADSTSGVPQADKTRSPQCSPTQVLSSQHNMTCSPTFFKKHIFFLVSETLGVHFRLLYKRKKRTHNKEKTHPVFTSSCEKILFSSFSPGCFFMPDSYHLNFLRNVSFSAFLPIACTCNLN